MDLTTFLLAVLAAVVATLIVSEIGAWSPWATRRVTQVAVRTLPPCLRERYDEEWRSYLADLPSDLARIISACGFFVAANKIALEFRREAINALVGTISALIRLPWWIYTLKNDRRTIDELANFSGIACPQLKLMNQNMWITYSRMFTPSGLQSNASELNELSDWLIAVRTKLQEFDAN